MGNKGSVKKFFPTLMSQIKNNRPKMEELKFKIKFDVFDKDIKFKVNMKNK
jgi:hypothetical protein